MVESRPAQKQEGSRSARDERCDNLAATLRQAFPIDGAGSFAGLLRVLDGQKR